jgi:hypothetical protein
MTTRKYRTTFQSSGGNIAGSKFIAHLCQRQKTENNCSSTDYSYDENWEWYNPADGWFGWFDDTDTHKESEYGTGYWSV